MDALPPEEAKSLLELCQTTIPYLALLTRVKHTGPKLRRIEQDVERDYIMTAQQAREYGMIDQIIEKAAMSEGRSAQL